MNHHERRSFRSCAWLAIAATLVCICAASAQNPDPKEIKFAVIGDFGGNNETEAAVAAMIESTIKPDFIVTVGDNNYLQNTVEGFDASVGRYFSSYIGNYNGAHGPGAATNRFWPVIGNHDWDETAGYRPYLEFFTLPGNERYYDFVQGPVHFFMMNSDIHEPDGRSRTSKQARWLKAALASSQSKWKFVVFHHPPFSSGDVHHSNPFLQWPFKQWGAHAVFSGHDHIYERLDVNGMMYFVTGFGGMSLYQLAEPLPQTQFRFNATFGAMKVTVNNDRAVFEAYTIENGGMLLDAFTLQTNTMVPDLVPTDAVWRYLDDGSVPPARWHERDFDDSAWKNGITQIGCGDGDETTVIDVDNDPERTRITIYLRHRFAVTDIENIEQLKLAMLVDDGAVAYINGREVARFNMPAGPIGHRTPASIEIEKYGENSFRDFTVRADAIIEGENVIAVEIHEADMASADVSFDLMLTPMFRQKGDRESPQKDAP